MISCLVQFPLSLNFLLQCLHLKGFSSVCGRRRGVGVAEQAGSESRESRVEGTGQRGHLPRSLVSGVWCTVTLSIFKFCPRFLAQIVENRETQLSSPFLGPGDNFSKSYDENQIWCAPARAPRERPWRVQSPRSCIRSHARGLAPAQLLQIWFSS